MRWGLPSQTDRGQLIFSLHDCPTPLSSPGLLEKASSQKGHDAWPLLAKWHQERKPGRVLLADLPQPPKLRALKPWEWGEFWTKIQIISPSTAMLSLLCAGLSPHSLCLAQHIQRSSDLHGMMGAPNTAPRSLRHSIPWALAQSSTQAPSSTRTSHAGGPAVPALRWRLLFCLCT